MNNILKIAAYTLWDQMRHKSFYVLLAVSILFILMIRGCYDGGYSVNGKMLDSTTVAWVVSKVVFHLIAVAMFLMVALLSMKIFSRDQEDGSMVLFLSGPVFRWHYVLGRMLGTWGLGFVFMFILHLTIFLTVWAKTGGVIPGYLTASLVCSVNLLFVIACVCFLSLFMPDFISALFTLGMLFVGFISDGGYQIFTSDLARSVAPSASSMEPALWRILFPKVFMVQAYADSILGQSQFHNMGSIPPLLNVSFFILLIVTLTVAGFHRKEIGS
ncbi:MAG: ABC transporter permease [Desulfobacteraceae bacterium]|nr:ABC transporter permease [Desulfobacteraceae bacterium]MBU4055348.1 ABC transporter permease [Pseudomonadota bacterium]